MSKQAVSQIIDALTAAAIAGRLSVSLHAVRYAKSDGLFPASWYAEVSNMCADRGLECPMTAFNWKRGEHVAAKPGAGDLCDGDAA